MIFWQLKWRFVVWHTSCEFEPPQYRWQHCSFNKHRDSRHCGQSHLRYQAVCLWYHYTTWFFISGTRYCAQRIQWNWPEAHQTLHPSGMYWLGCCWVHMCRYPIYWADVVGHDCGSHAAVRCQGSWWTIGPMTRLMTKQIRSRIQVADSL